MVASVPAVTGYWRGFVRETDSLTRSRRRRSFTGASRPRARNEVRRAGVAADRGRVVVKQPCCECLQYGVTHIIAFEKEMPGRSGGDIGETLFGPFFQPENIGSTGNHDRNCQPRFVKRGSNALHVFH